MTMLTINKNPAQFFLNAVSPKRVLLKASFILLISTGLNTIAIVSLN